MKSACFCIMYILLGFYGIAAAEPVHFRDANLKAAVEYELGVVDPSSDDMLNLTYLVAGGCNIIDLTGLEYAHYLQYLYLFDNQIRELSPLANLHYLYELWLDGNEIRDISPLNGLWRLQMLSLYDNQIRDITSIGSLGSLSILWLDQNLIQDISALENLQYLNDLWLDDNQIENIDSLTLLHNLEHLSLTNNPLNRAAYYIGFDIIEYHNAGIVLDYDPDPDPGNCPELIIPDYNLHLVIAMELGILMPTADDLLALTNLYASGHEIVNLEGLEYAVNLVELELFYNQIEDITPLTTLNHLEYLNLEGNQLITEAYCFDLPAVQENNPNLQNLFYDTNPNPLTADCSTSLNEFWILSIYWLSEDCWDNYWCEGADMDFSGSVTLEDFCIFCSLWLAE